MYGEIESVHQSNQMVNLTVTEVKLEKPYIAVWSHNGETES